MREYCQRVVNGSPDYVTRRSIQKWFDYDHLFGYTTHVALDSINSNSGLFPLSG